MTDLGSSYSQEISNVSVEFIDFWRVLSSPWVQVVARMPKELDRLFPYNFACSSA
jgi:hypothetical protein